MASSTSLIASTSAKPPEMELAGGTVLKCSESDHKVYWEAGMSGGVWAAAVCPRGAAAYFEVEVIELSHRGGLHLGAASGCWFSNGDGNDDGTTEMRSRHGCQTVLIGEMRRYYYRSSEQYLVIQAEVMTLMRENLKT